MRPALPTLALLLTLALNAAAATENPWQALGPGGAIYELKASDTPTNSPWRVQRRSGGGADAGYGERGSAAVSLGPDQEEPAVLRVDAQGRAWVAGASDGAEGLRAVVLRFLDSGLPDRRFGVNGRASLAPAGHEARALDLQVQEDGSAWVAGTVTDTGDRERVGVWRLREDGSLDMRVPKGLWMDEERGEAELAGLRRAPDGGMALGLRRADATRVLLETWTWRDGQTPRRTETVAVSPQSAMALQLAWQDGIWRWTDTSVPLAAAPAVTAAAPDPVREAPAAAIATPFSERSAASAVAPAQAQEEEHAWAAGWWLLLPAGLGALWWWRRQGAAGA